MIKISYSEHVWFSDFSIKVFFFFSFGMKTCLGKEYKTKVNSQKTDRKLALIEVLPIKYDFWVPCTSVETKNILPWWQIARVDSQGKVDVLNLKKGKAMSHSHCVTQKSYSTYVTIPTYDNSNIANICLCFLSVLCWYESFLKGGFWK